MPTLIRLLVLLLVLGGLAFGAMFALVALVDPAEKEVTIRIPARTLVAPPERDPLIRREIDTSRPVEPSPTQPAPAPTAPAAPAAGEQETPAADGDVVTLSPGIE